MGYVRNTYGCHCFYGDSSFKRYNRAALGDTFIFNYNSNNTYNCCGGHGGGFWGGLGMGLGMGFGNFLGGFCGNLFGGFGNMFGGFGNMFGGFGMGNMFGGFGFPSFNFGNWGFGGTPAASSSNNTSTTKTVTVTKENADYAPINRLEERLYALVKDPNRKAEDIDALAKDVDAKIKEYEDKGNKFDEIQDAEDIGRLRKFKQHLEDLKAGKVPDDEDLTKDNEFGVEGLTPEDLTTLRNLKIRVINYDGKNGDAKGWSLPTPMSVENLQKLKAIADKTNMAVACANNTQAGLDKWIAGKIDDIKEVNGKLEYTIDCQNYGKLEFKHQVKQKEGNKYSVDRIDLGRAKESEYNHTPQDYDLYDGKLNRHGTSVNTVKTKKN